LKNIFSYTRVRINIAQKYHVFVLYPILLLFSITLVKSEKSN